MVHYSNSKFEITILAERIFKLMPFEGVELDTSDVLEMRNVYLRLSNNENFTVLLVAYNHFSITPEARTLLASKEFTDKRIAAAFVTRSLANKLIGNFFIQFNRPATPTKMFNDETNAFDWLKEQIKKKGFDISTRHQSK